jgi:serine/threonine protein kinase
MQIVSHPLLVEFKECLQTKRQLYIVTELVRGSNLFEFVKRLPVPRRVRRGRIAQQVIVGVRFLHSFEIVHRDLKPENIMVGTAIDPPALQQQSKPATAQHP